MEGVQVAGGFDRSLLNFFDNFLGILFFEYNVFDERLIRLSLKIFFVYCFYLLMQMMFISFLFKNFFEVFFMVGFQIYSVGYYGNILEFGCIVGSWEQKGFYALKFL